MRRGVIGWMAGLISLGAGSVVAGDKAPVLQVPPGFHIEKVAGGPAIRFPMFACFDDRGRLFVAESSGLDLYAEISAGTRKCRISLLEDRDDDGVFETSTVFADKLVFPMGLVWRDGKLFVADPPDLVALEDTDGDGKAERRSVLLSGFGHKDNGSLHGLTFGPDGWLYMTLGNPDGYRFMRPDGSILEGRSGALIRCRVDGSQPEVLCRGFENLVEVVFTGRGDCIGTDNWFQRPKDGNRDALVHLIDGGLYPYNPDVGTPLPVTGKKLGPVSLYPAVALSGLERYRGPSFPAEMHGNLFSAQHNARKIGRHVLAAEGSTFRARDFDFVTTEDPDFHPSDVLEAADGSLIVVDTGSWYVHHCPTGKIRKVLAPGGIYRVKANKAPALADPWGAKVAWAEVGVDRLVEMLADPRPVVRDRAQRTLSGRGKAAVDTLAAAVFSKKDMTARQQALWALAGIADDAALAPLRRALASGDPDLVVPAARVLALRKDRAGRDELTRLLAADSLPIRLAAAEALSRVGDKTTLPALYQALCEKTDPFLEHALLHAVFQIAGTKDLEAALDHAQPQVQRAALVLLDQPPHPKGTLQAGMVLHRAKAADADLRQAALDALQRHPEWAEEALGLLRGWLGQEKLADEERRGLHSLVLAFQKQRGLQELVGAGLSDKSGKTALPQRLVLVEAIAESSLPALPPSWINGLSDILQEPDTPLGRQALRTAATLQIPKLDEQLARIAEDALKPAPIRLEALRGVVARRPKLSAGAFDFLLAQIEDRDQPLARLGAAETLGRCHLSPIQMSRLLKAIQGDTLVSVPVVLPALQRSLSPETAPVILDYLHQGLRTGWRPSETELEQVLKTFPAPISSKTEPLRELLRKNMAEQSKRLASFEGLLVDGDAENGKRVFFGKKVACATCHRIGPEGGTMGPDLTKVGAIRSGRDILEAIVLPSSTIAQGFDLYSVETGDGRVVNGVIQRPTAETLLVRDSSGGEVRLRQDQVLEMRRLSTSLMPEGLERALSAEEMRDLLAFLRGLR